MRWLSVLLGLLGLLIVVITGPLDYRRFVPDKATTKYSFLVSDGSSSQPRYLADLDGNLSDPLNPSGDIRVYAGWSGDGEWLYFIRISPRTPTGVNNMGIIQLWQMPVAGGRGRLIDYLHQPFLPSPSQSGGPVGDIGIYSGQATPPAYVVQWTPDGEWMLYPKLNRGGRIDLIKRSADGREALNLTNGSVPYIYFDVSNYRLHFSPDSQWVYFSGIGANGFRHVFRASLDGLLTEDITASFAGDISLAYVMPDGEWLTLLSSKADQMATYWKMRVDGSELSEISALAVPNGQRWLTAYLPKAKILLFGDAGTNGSKGFHWPDGELYWSYPNSTYLGVSPDEEWLVFCEEESGQTGLATMHPNGTSQRFLGTSCDQGPMGWTRSGDWYVSMAQNPSTRGYNLRRMRIDGRSEMIGARGDALGFSRWTPDGEWILAYGRRERDATGGIYRVRPDGRAIKLIIPMDERHLTYVEAMGPTITIAPKQTKWQPSQWLWGGIGFIGLGIVAWILKRPKAS